MSTCAAHFVNSLLTDIGVDFVERVIIEAKLLTVFNTFVENRSTVTVSQIAEEFYQCISPVLNDGLFIAQQIAYAIFFVLLITTILILLIASTLYILRNSGRGGLLISLWIIFIIFYMLAVTLILANAGINIANKATVDSVIIRNCVNKAVNELNLLLENEQIAINLALCAYPG